MKGFAGVLKGPPEWISIHNSFKNVLVEIYKAADTHCYFLAGTTEEFFAHGACADKLQFCSWLKKCFVFAFPHLYSKVASLCSWLYRSFRAV